MDIHGSYIWALLTTYWDDPPSTRHKNTCTSNSSGEGSPVCNPFWIANHHLGGVKSPFVTGQSIVRHSSHQRPFFFNATWECKYLDEAAKVKESKKEPVFKCLRFWNKNVFKSSCKRGPGVEPCPDGPGVIAASPGASGHLWRTANIVQAAGGKCLPWWSSCFSSQGHSTTKDDTLLTLFL